jgi:ABC-2 type transport system permease protein
MQQLLRTEWLKIKNYSAFIVISSFFGIGVPAINYISYIFKKNVIDASDPTGFISGTSPFAFPKVWQSVSYLSGWLLLLPALLLLILMTNEFTYRTNRQNIIDGWSRQQFLNVKVVMGVLFAVAATLFVLLTAVVMGAATGSSFSLTGFANIGYFFMKALSYNMIALLIGVLVRRTGFAIAILFIYSVLENGISLWFFTLAIKFKKENNFDVGDFGSYLPMNASDALIYSPFENITKLTPGMPKDLFWVTFAFAIFYIVLFYMLSKRRMVKSDL